MRSLHDTTRAYVTNAAGARTNGTDAGTAVDCADSDAIQFLIPVGTWTDGSHDVQFFHREASTDSWVRVPLIDLDALTDANLTSETVSTVTVGLVTVGDATLDDTFVQVGYIGGQRYVKADIVTTGATTGATLGVHVQLARLRHTGMNPMLSDWNS